jgi:hypothetical protein
MKPSLPQWPSAEPMVNAPAAARALELPLHLFTRPSTRTARAVPFYRIGHAIRFRVSELKAWSAQQRETGARNKGAA